MTAGPLTARLAALCDDVADRLGAQAREQVEQLRRRAGEPLRVAVAGRLKAGKSTLVNALIGRRVAPTAVGECTRLVTRFRYGPTDRVLVVRRDGGTVNRPLDDDGMIPQRLGVPAADVDHVDVTLTSDRLRELTVLDTPGLSSTSTAVSAAAQRVLDDSGAPFDDGVDAASADAVGGADAVIYVFTQAVRADDVQALEAFRAAAARLSGGPGTALGVLSKADKLAGGDADPWPAADRLAAEQRTVLRHVVADVVPVVGLLAETCETGRLTATDCTALRALAALPAAERVLLLASADLFTTRVAPVDAGQRRRLLELLDSYGIGYALDRLTADPRLDSADLLRLLGDASGLPRLRRGLDETFRWRADAIKAGWLLARLDRLAAHTPHPADRNVLRDALDEVHSQPEHHRLRLLAAAQQVSCGAVTLPDAMQRELTRLAFGDDAGWILDLPNADAGRLAGAAAEAATRWQVYAVAGAAPAQARVAQVVHRGFHLLAQRLRARTAGPPR